MELFRCLAQALHNDLNRITCQPKYKELTGEGQPTDVADEWWRYACTRDDSLVTDLFRGQFLTILTCGSCGQQTFSADTFLDLPVPINPKQSCTLQDCFEEFNGIESIDDYTCEKCGQRTTVAKQMWVYRLPKILAVQLKRFSHTGYTREKLETDVHCPEQIDLDSQCILANPGPSGYELYGICHHSGTIENGHYTAEVKVDGHWYLFDDSKVTPISGPTTNQDTAYILFYKREDFS